MLLNYIFLILAACPTLWAQRDCSRDRLRQCEDSLLRSIQRRINDMSRTEMGSHCDTIREDFNCLLKETRCLSSDSERNRKGDSLRNALMYIRDGCDTSGQTWKDNSCFMSSDMKKCSESNPMGGAQYSSYNPEGCRKFNLYQDCVTDNLQNRCRPEDKRFLGTYLVENYQELAWSCGKPEALDMDSNSRNYDRYNDRIGDRDRDRGRDQYRSNYRDYDRGGYRDSDRYSDRYSPYGNGSSDITCCRSERCDRSRQQQCRDSITRTLENRMSGYQDSQKCRKFRDDFNCLLWQTANCGNRDNTDRDSDIFRRARDYMSRNCDTYGRWSENSCFKSSEMQRCESSLSNTRAGANYESCRSYNNFKDCMTDELLRRCTREDELFQGAYLMDKAQEMSWQCSSQSMNGRNQYYTNGRRDQYDSPYSGGGGGGGYDSPYNGGYDNPQHLEDDDAMCLSRVQSYADQCKKNLDDKRRDLYTENDYDVRQKITCCSAREYRSCLYDSTRRICQSERSRVVDSLMGRFRYELNADTCRRIYDSDCSGSTRLHISFILLAACVTVLSTFFAIHL